jgi:hypothetical protein
MTQNPWVRPYVLTKGRTRTRHRLLVETLVSVPHYHPGVAESLMPESRALYEAARATLSVAELSARSRLGLGVTRVLLSDLAAQDWIRVHPTATASSPDIPVSLLERVRDGLARI